MADYPMIQHFFRSIANFGDLGIVLPLAGIVALALATLHSWRAALAWALAQRGLSVTIIEGGRIGQGASWAAAGVLASDWNGTDPPALSVAASATVTVLLFQPEALGAGDGVAVVVGGVVSAAARLRIGKTPESDVALSAGSITISAVNVWSRSATSLGGGSGKSGPIAPGANAFGASVRAAISAEIWNRTVRGVALAATSAVNASEMLKL